jgi:hypothetical protein
MKINKLLFFIYSLILINSFVFSQNINLGDRYDINKFGFSFCPPVSFVGKEFDGINIFIGIPVNNYTPNIFFMAHLYGNSLEETVDLLILSAEKNSRNFSLIKEDFFTNNGIIGKRIVMVYELSSGPIKSIHYFFENNNLRFSISSTVSLDFNDEYFKILDESIKTLQWLK